MRPSSEKTPSLNRPASVPEPLATSEERLRLVLNAAEMAIWAWDLETDALQADALLNTFLGVSPDALPTAETFFDHVHPDDLPGLKASINAAMTCGGEYEHEFRIVRADGAVRWLGGKGRVFCDEEGTAVRMLGVNFDVTGRKRTTEALHESEARFHALADSAPVLIWASDEENSGTYFNRRWLEFTGRTMEQELGFGWIEGVHPDDRARAARFCQRHFDTRQEFRMEFRLRRADGAYRWMLDHGVPRYTTDGTFLGYVGSVIDIHDRKQAEAALREREERYRTLFTSIDEGFCLGEMILDEKGQPVDYRFLDVNPRFEEQTGLIDPVGKTARELVPDLEQYWVQTYARSALGGETFRFESGSEAMGRWFDVYAAPAEPAGSNRFVLVFKDVTEWKAAERARGLLAAIVTSSGDAIVSKTLDGIITSWNAGAERLFGYTAEEAIGRPVLMLIPPERRNEEDHILSQIRRGERVDHYETVRLTKGGRRIDVSLSVSPVRDGTGRIIGASKVARDITRQKEAEEVLRASEAHFRTMADAAPALLWITNPQGVCTFLSQGWYDYTGRTEETSLGNGWIEAGHPDDRAAARAAFFEANAKQQPFHIDYRMRRHDGVYRWAIVAGQPHFDAAGHYLGFIGSVIDIHDRKQAEVRAHYLAETGTLVEQALDYEATLQQIARLAVPGFADWCAVDLLHDDGSISAVAIAHADTEKVKWAWKLREREPIDPANPTGVPNVIRTGQPELYPHISDELLQASARDEEHLALMRELGLSSVILVPLRAGTETIGAISFINTESGRRFDEADLTTASEIARRAGGALETARLHATIRAREEEFAALANNIPQLAWMADESGSVFWYNQRWYDYTGTSFDAMRGWGWQNVHHPEHVERVIKGFKQHVEAGEPWEDLFPLRSKHGQWRWFLSRAMPIRDAEGRIIRWFGTNTDVTESRELEQTLRESEAQFRRLAETLPDIVYTLPSNESRDTEYLNARWYEYTGLPPGTTYREAAAGVVHPDDLLRVARAWTEARQTGDVLEMEIRLRRHDGEYRWFITRLVPVRDEQDHIDRWFGTSTDIHAQKAVEAELEARVATRTVELEQANRALRERNRELQDFAYVASHDLQEPLRKIQAFTGLLVGDHGEALGEQGRFLTGRIQDAAGRMTQLIRDLLAFSRVQTQGQPFAETDLDAVLQEVLSDLEVRITETGGRIDATPLPVIKADRTQMRQLLQNLIGNALKFHREDMPPVVTVRGAMEPPGPDQLAPMLRLTVEDNGIGFDERFADRIFVPFQRLHGRSEYEGTGIGLAICRKIAERHGGAISVHAAPGEGATFTVLLPTRQAEVSPSQAA